MGAGAALFLRSGAALNVSDVTFSGDTVAGGTGMNPGKGLGQALFFMDTATAVTYTVTSGTVTISETVSSAPSIQNSGGFIKAGAGTLVLTADNAMNGTVTIAAGTLQANTTAHWAAPVVDNGTLVFGQTTSETYVYPISGTGAVVKTGTGTVLLGPQNFGTNTYAAGTTILAGTLAGGPPSFGPGPIIDNDVLEFRWLGTGTSGTFTNPISGTGAVTKSLSGVIILPNANSYSGGTTVNAGTLMVTNPSGSATGTGPVTVANGATLAGGDGGSSFTDSTVGFIAGPVTVQSGGRLAPGMPAAGVLTVAGPVTFQTGASFSFYAITDFPRIGTAPADVNYNGRVVTAADLLFGSALTVAIDGNGYPFAPGYSYDFYLGEAGGTVGPLPTNVTFAPTDFGNPVNPTDFTLSVSPDGHDLILTYTPVPEPGSLTLLAAAAVAGWRWRRQLTA
jgi:autotransporter-associated beta strand protein